MLSKPKLRYVMFSIAAALVLSACGGTRQARVEGKPVDNADNIAGIVTVSKHQGTLATWKLKPTSRLFVCLDMMCTKPAPEPLRESLREMGIHTAADKDEADYTLSIRGFVTTKISLKNGEEIIAPVYALPLLAQKDENEKLPPWIGNGYGIDDLGSKGMSAFSLLATNIKVYDTLWHQSGQLTQTIGGGSPGAYALGFFLEPLVNLFFTMKAKSDLKEGLAGVEMIFMPKEGAFRTLRTVYAFAGSSREEAPAKLIRSATMEALDAAREFWETGG